MSATMQTWREMLWRCKYFVDVGAHAGSYSHLAVKMGARGIAIEPNADLVTGLIHRLKGYDVTILRAAAGEQVGTTTLYVPDDDHLSTISPDRRSFRKEVEEQEVTMLTLDSLHIYEPVVIKIDVERSADRVLRGAKQTLPYAVGLLIEVIGTEEREGVEEILVDDFKIEQVDSKNIYAEWR